MKQIMDSRSPATKEEDVRPVTLQLIKDATGFRGGVLWLKFVQSQAFIKHGTEISSSLQFIAAMAGQFNPDTATEEEQVLHQLCAQKLARVLEQQKFEKATTQAERAESWWNMKNLYGQADMVIDVGSRLIYHSERAPTTELDTSVEVIVNLVGTASNEREGQVLVFGLAGSNISSWVHISDLYPTKPKDADEIDVKSEDEADQEKSYTRREKVLLTSMGPDYCGHRLTDFIEAAGKDPKTKVSYFTALEQLLFTHGKRLYEKNPVVQQAVMFGCAMRMSNVVIAAIGTFFGGPNAQMMSRMLNVTLKFPGSMSGFAEAIKVYLQTSENNFDCRQCLRRVVVLIFETASDGIKRLANPTELRAAENDCYGSSYNDGEARHKRT